MFGMAARWSGCQLSTGCSGRSAARPAAEPERYAGLTLARRCAVRWAPLLPLVLLVAACADHPSAPHRTASQRWLMQTDSLNFAIFIVDADTYAFEGGTLSYYAPCGGCAEDSLPMRIREGDGDFGWILFSYASTGDTLFAANMAWMGPKDIQYPHAFVPPDSFETLEPVTQPTNVERFQSSETHFSAEAMAAATDSVWSVISSLDLVHAFAGRKLRVGYFYYPFCGNDFPGAKWVVFLCRGNE